MRTKYKHKFDKIVFNCRWFKPKWDRRNDYIVFGLFIRGFSWKEYEYVIGLFGLEIRIWFTKEVKN
jgi:hypothetical protein